jgi:hypothetical protein
MNKEGSTLRLSRNYTNPSSAHKYTVFASHARDWIIVERDDDDIGELSIVVVVQGSRLISR